MRGPQRWRRGVIALLALGLIHCDDRVGTHRSTFYVFGTLVDITIDGLPVDQTQEVTASISHRLQRLHKDWHAWKPGGLIDLNARLAGGHEVTVTPELASLLKASQELEDLSGGRFNPAIGGLIRLWGFHTDVYPVTTPPPSHESINGALMSAPSSKDLTIRGNRITSSNPAVELDLGGIGKGAAVDVAIRMLVEAGAPGGIVNAGGDLRVYGTRSGQPWVIAVRDPTGDGEETLGSLQANFDEAVFTSGNYLRYREDDNRKWGHIVDPRTGWPVGHVLAATVIAGNGTLADAAATSLVVAGQEDWRQVAVAMGIKEALIVSEDGCIAMTEAMSARLQFADDPDCVEIVP